MRTDLPFSERISGNAAPRLRKWSHSSSISSATSIGSDYIRENIGTALGKQLDKKVYPEFQDGASAWYDTVDRLSRKVNAARHELLDIQSKLRIEVEKNRDLSKIIQAERKEHREVVSALTAKIKALERKLREIEGVCDTTTVAGYHNRAASTSRIEIEKSPMTPRPDTNQQPEIKEEKSPSNSPKHDDAHVAAVMESLFSKINALTVENAKLKIRMRSQSPLADHGNVDINVAPSQPGSGAPTPKQTLASPLHMHQPPYGTQSAVPTLQPAAEAQSIPPQTQLYDYQPPYTAPPQAQAQPVWSAVQPTDPPRPEVSDAITQKLTDQLKQQNEEIALQKVRYEELRSLMDRVVAGLAQGDGISQKPQPSFELPKEQTQAQPESTEPPPLASSMLSPPSSAESRFPKPEDDSTIQQSLSTSILSSAKPPLHSSTNLSNATADSIPTTPSTNSTPRLKLRSSTRSSDGSTNRLNALYKQLKQGTLSKPELERYEDIYNHLPQALAERPQLFADTKQLLEHLQNRAPVKHAAVLNEMANELD